MAEFKIDGRMTVRTLKESFKNEFEGTLRVYNGREKADDNVTLATIRKVDDVKSGDYVCRASRTVGKFEEEMMEVFGIKVQVASPDDWVLALDGITLANLKNIKPKATKADMEELVAYKLQTAPEIIGHVLAHATLVFGESATMVSEAAMLGIPGIYIDNTGRLYTRDLQERYGLCWCYTESAVDQKRAITKAVELLSREPEALAQQMHEALRKLLHDKIDCTGFLTYFIEGYPATGKEVKNADEEFWRRFKI